MEKLFVDERGNIGPFSRTATLLRAQGVSEDELVWIFSGSDPFRRVNQLPTQECGISLEALFAGPAAFIKTPKS